MKRVNFYIDGFNLYFGMVEAGLLHCKWLDIHAFAVNLKNSSQTLNKVKYFTSRVNNNIEKQKRQSTFLDANSLSDNVEIIYGQFRSEKANCKTCGNDWFESKEKMTDVNISTHLMNDAYKDNFDVAIIVTGDSDIVPPIRFVRDLFPSKEIRVAFPPNRESNELKKVAHGSFTIGKMKLETAQLVGEVVNKYGDVLKKPKEWI
jgi:uncharacterized LabA/DUF88 family protein